MVKEQKYYDVQLHYDKTYKRVVQLGFPWPQNLYTAIMRGYIDDPQKSYPKENIPKDWENTLNYIFENFFTDKMVDCILKYYRDKSTLSDIANEYNQTSTVISNTIDRAFRLIRIYPERAKLLTYGVERYFRMREVSSKKDKAMTVQRLHFSLITKRPSDRLNVRILNALNRKGINTIDELFERLRPCDLQHLHNFGKMSETRLLKIIEEDFGMIPSVDKSLWVQTV